MTEKTYGPLELLSAHQQTPPDTFSVRRELAASLRELSEHLVRSGADDAQLSRWTEQAKAMLDEARNHERRDTRAANKKLFTGQATATDVFDMMDYDAMGGLSNPVSPALQWRKLDNEGVEASVYLGQQYQGPPGRVHGGVLAWILDAVLARAMHASMRIGVTGTLSLRYMASTPIETELTCRANVIRAEGRKLFIEGGIFNGDEQTVKAEGIWLQPKFAG